VAASNEAHVEHPIRFVDNEQAALVQHDLAAAEQIHQPAGGGDEDVDTFFEGSKLVSHTHPADKQRHVQLVIFTIFIEIFTDLLRQFACRFEDERTRHARPAATFGQNVDHRQHE
jgi:hypothetical protein